MGTAGRTAPLRRTGSLLGLLGLEVAAVLGLHGLGRFAGLRIGWDEPVSWLLNSPIQNVLGSVLRMVALVMAYWLLASTVAYLLASLTRLPGAVRAVGWATLPLVRRVADHAVAVTLATSMVGGTTLGVAGPALAADGRSFGPPAPKPVAAAQDGPTTTEPQPTRTSEPVYTPDPADQVPTTTAPRATPPPTTEPEPTRTSEPVYTPDPADQAPRRVQEESTTTREAATTTTAGPTTTTEAATTTTAAATTATAGPTTRQEATTSTQAPTTATTRPPTTTALPTTAAPTTAAPSTRQGTAAPTSASTTGTTRPGAAGTTATTHAYTPEAASDPPEADQANPGSTTTTNPGGGGNGGTGGTGGTGGSDQGPSDQGTGGQEEQRHRVVAGDNLWMIARDHLSRKRSGGSGKPTNHEVAAYWIKVVEANRDRLRSGDPDLIYPEEQITLPPVD
jgi:uncharacterized membrane protein YgcG